MAMKDIPFIAGMSQGEGGAAGHALPTSHVWFKKA